MIALSYGVAATRNPRHRKTMEDAHKCVLDFMNPGDGYFGVFDGHAGPMAADWCADRLHQVLEDNVRRYGMQLQLGAIIAGTFDQVDHILPQVEGFDGSGCTAAVAYVKMNADKSRTLYTANAGDARIVISYDGRAERLSRDHRPTDFEECGRVKACGGTIMNNRVMGVLAVTRALGDPDLKQFVSGKPYTTETRLDPYRDEFLIIACDGLWDVVNDQEAVDLIRHVEDPKSAAKMLIRHAMQRGTLDNVTCLVVRLIKQSRPTSSSSTNAYGDIIGYNPTSKQKATSVLQYNDRERGGHSRSSSRHSSRTFSGYNDDLPRIKTPPAGWLTQRIEPSNRRYVDDFDNPGGHYFPAEPRTTYPRPHRFSMNEDQQRKHLYRYGERRKSVPCIFDDGQSNSDAIAEDDF